jgi:hypothetical protein
VRRRECAEDDGGGLMYVIGLGYPPPTARANQFSVPTLAPYPQLQGLGPLVDFVLIDSVAWPPQNFGLAHVCTFGL